VTFDIGICGEGRIDPKMESDAGQKLIRRLCEGPVEVGSVEPELLEAFKKMQAVRVEGGRCFLNFTCFLKLVLGYVWLSGLREPLAESAYRDIFINYSMMFLCVALIYNIADIIGSKRKNQNNQSL
jgi:hypothetical protein